MNKRFLVNLVSLSRIPLSFLFIIFFQPNEVLLFISIGISILVFFTDVLDGFLARYFNIDSVLGRQWDSLGDKSFYLSVIVSFNTHNILTPVLCWGLLLREVTLYITRVLFYEKIDKIELIRPYTNWHGYFMYTTIVLGYVNMFSFIHSGIYSYFFYIQIAALIALIFGVGSIFKFLNLK